MLYWIISLSVLLFIAVLVFALMCICFFRIFYSPRAKKKKADEYPTPEGKAYDPHREQIIKWIKEIRAMEYTAVSVVSYDGLRLCGKYYEYKKGAPIEILFHGYKGTAERDLCGGVYRCFELGHNALIVDHRASGKSEGRIITFGVKESRDCLTWIDFAINSIDKDAKIIITGISMGAATVMIAAGRELPTNVVGVLSDCGYTSAKDIIKKVMEDMKLPSGLLYPFARISAMVFGGFDPDKASPISAMRKCRLPIIFFHGDKDGYVPCYMSEENYSACISEHKRLVIISGADHGLCFPVDMKTYFAELEQFFAPHL
ncbi:MAG: alpha/beta hydrolase [Clostridia bacterium]|nr:alpha/beta hydrolase [Clostridia bacterium]